MVICYIAGTYCYHSDHLGSATWITTKTGQPVEYLHYMPYGELWRDQRATSYNERFRFTGKERDSETEYDYFGARYYSSTLSLWLSVDPLAGEYPNLSPYAYCANNPIKNIDPDGKVIETAWDILNIGLDIQSLEDNVQKGNVSEAILDGVGLFIDAAATILPFVPAGAGTALKATRTTKFLENVNRGRQSEKVILNEMDSVKNTKKLNLRPIKGNDF